ncbi:hypothetical protein [Namhaeicola litoreus]|uniref:NIPSNAP protein n=1 Tax=Namhaeicola litoreus TaxID=1052145 RepID=A0ABW3Y0V0_9FLAO
MLRNHILKTAFFVLAMLVCTIGIGQDFSQDNYYVTLLRLQGEVDDDRASWQAIEQEFFDKVIKKNKYIVGHEMLVDTFDERLSEVLIVNIYKDWNDIELARKRTMELIEEGWPDEKERAAYFEKQNRNFSLYYSNQIMTTTKNVKIRDREKDDRTKPLTFYLVFNKLVDNPDDDLINAYEDYLQFVTFKDPNIRSYQAYRHFFGPDSRDFLEVYVTDSYDDLLNSFELDKALLMQMFPDEKEREDFIEIYNAGVVQEEGKVYENIPAQSKYLE